MNTLGNQPEPDWRQAALRVGEELASTGPPGYYTFSPAQWRDWALACLRAAAVVGDRQADQSRIVEPSGLL